MTKAKLVEIKKLDEYNLIAIFKSVDKKRTYNFSISANSYYSCVHEELELNVGNYYYLLTDDEFKKNLYKIQDDMNPWVFSRCMGGSLMTFYDWETKKEYDCRYNYFECNICVKRKLKRSAFRRVPKTYDERTGYCFNYSIGVDYMEEIYRTGYIRGTTL